MLTSEERNLIHCDPFSTVITQIFDRLLFITVAIPIMGIVFEEIYRFLISNLRIVITFFHFLLTFPSILKFVSSSHLPTFQFKSMHQFLWGLYKRIFWLDLFWGLEKPNPFVK